MKRKTFSRAKKKKIPLELDITSLMDILVILLVFLLKNFNAADLTLDLVKGITLPTSTSRNLGTNSVNIMVNKQKEIYVDNKLIGNANHKSEELADLFKALTDKKEKYDMKMAIKEEQKTGRDVASVKDHRPLTLTKANIAIDQNLHYEVLRKIMHTASLAGFHQFKFIVQGDYQ